MKDENKRLSGIAVGESCVVRELYQCGPVRQRLIDLGLMPGEKVRCVGESPMGNPRAYAIRGALIAIRNGDADFIGVAELSLRD